MNFAPVLKKSSEISKRSDTAWTPAKTVKLNIDRIKVFTFAQSPNPQKKPTWIPDDRRGDFLRASIVLVGHSAMRSSGLSAPRPLLGCADSRP
jgi:hypothetical protein